MSNEDTLEHKIKSVDQNLDDKFELVIEEANTLQKNIAESIQANNKSLELFENVSLKYIISLSGFFCGFMFFDSLGFWSSGIASPKIPRDPPSKLLFYELR